MSVNPKPADVESIDGIITALYDVISGPAGERDWDRFRSLFLPEGSRLIPTGERPNGQSGLSVMTVDDFVNTAGEFFRTSAFYESEIARRTESFGNVAHAFSTYETRIDADAQLPFMRGINSIQLLNRDGRWWVVTIFWDNESEATPIPAQYLPA